MALAVSGRLVSGPSNLSETSRLTLAFISGGAEFVHWACSDPMARYEFENEPALLEGVQKGLHGSPLTLLPNIGLQVSPVKLMSVSFSDLRIVARAEGAGLDDALRSRLSAILAQNGLVTSAELGSVRPFLSSLKVGDAPLFAVLDLNEMLALHRLAATPPSHLSQEAARFAVEEATTPLEFADYYLAYLGYVARVMPNVSDPARRLEGVKTALMTLMPLLFPTLQAPSLKTPASPQEVARALEDWLRMGRMLGFERLSRAAACILLHSGYDGARGDAAKSVIQAYFSSAQSVLARHPPSSGLLGQDGKSVLFPVEKDRLLAELLLTAEGTLVLNSLRPAPVTKPRD